VVRFFEELAHDIQTLLASLGLPSLDAAIGRTDLLEQVSHAGGLDLSALLAPVQEGPVRWQGARNRRPSDHAAIDNAWVQPALAARAAGEPFSVEATIANQHRTLGARLAGELVWHGLHTTHTPLDFKLTGIAGQSFGAFAIPGMKLVLEGLANDFVGKGLCGGELILRGQGRAARESELHVILGNVALYGATSGSLFAAGRAGERFAVRNSGALAVVEGVGDHGCEYMTGGKVVVLGSTGQNFGAGMTGGKAWVFDEDGAFLSQTRYHTGFLNPEPMDAEALDELRKLIELHADKTASTRAHWILKDWSNLSTRFVRLVPLPQA
jgi:glutamate synthase (NADPH/NADH) large chain